MMMQILVYCNMYVDSDLFWGFRSGNTSRICCSSWGL